MNTNGARWVRVDLHLHSPGVDSFTLPHGINLESNDDMDKLAGDYVRKLKDSNIKVAAITDYNRVCKEWFDLIRTKASAESIIVLPGIELSVDGGRSGLHILLIFEAETNTENLNHLIYSKHEGFPDSELFENRAHMNLILKDTTIQKIIEIRSKYNSLIIFAHPDEDKGFFKSFDPAMAVGNMKKINPDALEYFSDSSKEKLLSAGKLEKDYFDNIAILENSDPKRLDEIGSKTRESKPRATYLKLSDYTIDALRLALQDPKLRVRKYDVPVMEYDNIRKVKINGTGFLKDVCIDVNPEMNTLIGGRGVGKSAIIEAIRYCLELPIYSDKSIREEFVKTVVGSGGEIRVEFEKFYGQTNKLFKIRRIIGKQPEVFDMDDNLLNILTNDVFGRNTPVMLGQKELYEVATNKDFLLKLVDELIGSGVDEWTKKIQTIKEQLESNARQITDIKKKLIKKEEYEQQLKTLDQKIEIYRELGVVDKIKRHMGIIADGEILTRTPSILSEIVVNINDVFISSKGKIASLINQLNSGRSDGIDVLKEAAKGLQHSLQSLINITISQEIATTKNEIENLLNTTWKTFRSGTDSEIDEIKRSIGADSIQIDDLELATKQKARIEPLLNEFSQLQKKLEELQEARRKVKHSLKEARHELFKAREKETSTINKSLRGQLRINIRYEVENENFKERITNLLKGSGVRIEAIDAMIKSNGKVIDGLMLSDYISKGAEEFARNFNGLTEAMASKLVEWFDKDEQRLFELELLMPEDSIDIELKVIDKFFNIDKLSMGQKATALLLLLFALKDRILILDQPEEDLDNRFIYEDVVQILRELKGTRQLLIASHNANIPVLGDSELIVVLDVEDERCRIKESGSIDKSSIRDQVKDIMEGGEEAFKLRAKKYGSLLERI